MKPRLATEIDDDVHHFPSISPARACSHGPEGVRVLGSCFWSIWGVALYNIKEYPLHPMRSAGLRKQRAELLYKTTASLDQQIAHTAGRLANRHLGANKSCSGL
jgi:hypothetical protein